MKILKFLGRCFFIFLIGLFIVKGTIFLYLKSVSKLELSTANNVMLYDDNGKLFFQGNKEKEWVNLKNISNYVIEATIYTEDKHFYKHNGFDYSRIIKASIVNIAKRKTSQGASTISQQYVKNLFLDFDKTWKRKWEEMWYTIRLENDYNKDEILEGYLNTINYGHGMYGIQNASEFYFNKDAKDLDLAEASMIIGIPKSPSNYSPLVNFDTAKKRQRLILSTLLENKVISKEEYNNALDEELNIIGHKNDDELTTIMYYHDAVIKELESINSIPKSLIDTNGLKIYTTYDEKAQLSLEQNIKKSLNDNSKIQTAAVMMRPNDGAIIALIGGKDYNESSFNRATDSKRQVGSTMKPYLYYAALENGFTSSTSFTSEETTFSFENNIKYSPKNYNNVYGNKPISMGTAVAYSDNIYAVKTHLFLGEDALINVAKRVGINSKLQKIPSLPLGTNEINIIEMAQGYSIFANLGLKINSHVIKKVEDKLGNVLYEYKNPNSQILNSSLCFILNNILTSTYDKDYIDYNMPTGIGIAPKMTHKYALKSGTTDTDNWNIGYNKDILTAVWVGYDDNQELKPSEYKYSQNIWLNSMEDYLKDKEDSWYEIPPNVSQVLVEPISGRPAKDTDPKKKIMYFIKGTEPTDNDLVFDEKIGNAVAS